MKNIVYKYFYLSIYTLHDLYLIGQTIGTYLKLELKPTSTFEKLRNKCDLLSSVSPTSSTTLHKRVDEIENLDISNFKTNDDQIINTATFASNVPKDNKLYHNESEYLDYLELPENVVLYYRTKNINCLMP